MTFDWGFLCPFFEISSLVLHWRADLIQRLGKEAAFAGRLSPYLVNTSITSVLMPEILSPGARNNFHHTEREDSKAKALRERERMALNYSC